MNRCARFLTPLLLALLLAPGVGAEPGSLDLTLEAAPPTVQLEGSSHRIEIPGFQSGAAPGAPTLPVRTVLVALPPGARAESVELIRRESRPVPGSFALPPAEGPVPLWDPAVGAESIQRYLDERERLRSEIYGSDALFPAGPVRLVGAGALGRWRYAALRFCPFAYHPVSGRLVHHPRVELRIRYERLPPGSPEGLREASLPAQPHLEARGADWFVNHEEAQTWYAPADTSSGNRTGADYLILTTEAMVPTIQATSWPAWKADLGHVLRYVRLTDPEITGQPGPDLAAQIRSYLRSAYADEPFRYLLLVGDVAVLPMRYCYPDPENHVSEPGFPNGTSGEIPTDHYYADLTDPDSASWDSDGDSFHGEYGQDEPDWMAELAVGRIPVSIPARISYTLEKLVAYEQDHGTWKDTALHGGAFFYLTNEDRSGRPAYDGCEYLEVVEQDLLQGWSLSRYSEQGGLEVSAYPWAPLDQGFMTDWRTGSYGAVNEGAHGWVNRAARKIWSWDDGDGIPESYVSGEITWPDFVGRMFDLDDDYLCTFTAISCLMGYPESNSAGRFGVDLLTKPGWGAGAGVLAATRVAWGSSVWPEVQPGFSEGLCYQWQRYMLQGPRGPEPMGDALYSAIGHLASLYAYDHYSEYWTLCNYNLYGDPSLHRGGAVPATPTPIPSPSPTPAPTCGATGVTLEMPAHHFGPGDTCWLKAEVCNDTGAPLVDHPLLVVLEAFGEYYCGPGWLPLEEGLDSYEQDYGPGSTRLTILEEFRWPNGLGVEVGMRFYGALMTPGMGELVGDVATWEFGWGF